jgi:geranylgeranyl diphosphate synthase type I
MNKENKIFNVFESHIKAIDEEIKRTLSDQDDLLMYDMMRYFFGYLDENLKKINDYGGKHFRSSLCLYLAESYGKKEDLIEVAAAIELFHNFTLIHDDIEDHDEIRRGKPTIWKKFGQEQAINTGDAQLILSNLEICKACEGVRGLDLSVAGYMNKVFLKVSEGQFLDMKMAELPLYHDFVNEENYLDMIKRKSAILVSASSGVVGIALGLPDKETRALSEYGQNLGLAYQIWDDIISIWGKEEDTGKKEAKDIYEKKKTLPILSLYERASNDEKRKLENIYNSPKIARKADLDYIYSLLNTYNIKAMTKQKVFSYIEKSNNAVKSLSISQGNKEFLLDVNRNLFPSIEEVK